MNSLHAAASAAAILLGAITGLVGTALLNPAPAHADGTCTTSHYSNTTYVICTYTDSTGYQHRTTETCYDGASTCSIKSD